MNLKCWQKIKSHLLYSHSMSMIVAKKMLKRENCWFIYRTRSSRKEWTCSCFVNLFFIVLNFHNLIWQFQLLTARGQPRTEFKSNINWYHFLFTPAKYSAPLWSENSKKGPLWKFYESAIKSRELGRVPVKGTREQTRSSQKYLDSY